MSKRRRSAVDRPDPLALAPKLIDHLQRAGARPGTLVHYHDEPADDGSVGVHVGYEIGQQPVPAGGGVEIVDLPVVQVASIVHRGGMGGIVRVYQDLIRWIEDSGYRRAGYSCELYHEMGADGPRSPSCRCRSPGDQVSSNDRFAICGAAGARDAKPDPCCRAWQEATRLSL